MPLIELVPLSTRPRGQCIDRLPIAPAGSA
jgi:hypothetical protein